MNESIVRKQQWRYMGYNLVAFSILFGLFGFIVYGQMRSTLFSRVDSELRAAQGMILEHPGFIDYQRDLRFDVPPAWQEQAAPTPGESRNNEGRARLRFLLPMRVQAIVRDEGGNIVNEQVLGRMYLENNLAELPWPPEGEDTITAFRMEGGSHFHSLAFSAANTAGEAFTVQLIVNVDGEQGLVDNFLSILVICVAVFVLLALAASYLLSRMNMAPLIRSWRRQAEFVENASHELRTPLTVIQNKLEGLLVTPQATVLDKADSVAVSLSETRRLAKLTSDLMTLARADSDAVQLTKEKFLLSELIASVGEPYREFAGMQGKKMELLLGDRDPVFLDRGRIHELMVILLDNALKYTREGDVITVQTSQRDGRVILEVKDTGIGIGEESAVRIFERFYRGDKARTRGYGGTGLGLSIAQWIVKSHGGSIRAYPNRLQGTVLEVRFPK